MLLLGPLSWSWTVGAAFSTGVPVRRTIVPGSESGFHGWAGVDESVLRYAATPRARAPWRQTHSLLTFS